MTPTQPGVFRWFRSQSVIGLMAHAVLMRDIPMFSATNANVSETNATELDIETHTTSTVSTITSSAIINGAVESKTGMHLTTVGPTAGSSGNINLTELNTTQADANTNTSGMSANTTSCLGKDSGPLFDIFFDEQCLLNLTIDLDSPAVEVARSFFSKSLGGLRFESCVSTFLGIVALFALMQLGGIPDPQTWSGTIMLICWFMVVWSQILCLLLTIVSAVAAYVVANEHLSPCMKPWRVNGDVPLLLLSNLPFMVFQPPVLAPVLLIVLYCALLLFGACILMDRIDPDHRKFSDIPYIQGIIAVPAGLLIHFFSIVAIITLVVFVVTSAIFGIPFFAPTTVVLVLVIAALLTFILHLRKYIIQPVWNVFCSYITFVTAIPDLWKDTTYQIWWIYLLKCAICGQRDRIPDNEILRNLLDFLLATIALIALSPLICYGGMIACHVYGGHSIEDNMHVVESVYKHHFGLFFDMNFNFPDLLKLAGECFDPDYIEEQIKAAWGAILSLGRVFEINPVFLLEGSNTFTFLSTMLSFVKLLVASFNALLFFGGLSTGNIALCKAISFKNGHYSTQDVDEVLGRKHADDPVNAASEAPEIAGSELPDPSVEPTPLTSTQQCRSQLAKTCNTHNSVGMQCTLEFEVIL